MQNEIVKSSEFLAPAVSVQDALMAYQAKKELIDGILREGVDYGSVTGSAKSALLKPGAEKMASFFALSPRFKDAEVVEDWTGREHGGEPFFYYRRTCELWRGERLIASADGSCNSWEKKYRYRWVSEFEIPAGIDKSILKTQGGKTSEFAFAIEKAETGGKYGKPAEYWKAWNDAINSGKAVSVKRKTSKGNELDAFEMDGTVYAVPNSDPAEQVNTILKMADKRALVAAVLIATGVSEYFTQDVDDFVTGEIVEGVVTATPRQIPYDTAKQVIIKTSAGEKFMGQLTKEQLDKVIANSKDPANIEAAKVVLAHDFGMEPITDPA